MSWRYTRIASAVTAAVACAVAIAFVPAIAGKDPWQLSAQFQEPRTAPPLKKGQSLCTVAITDIEDARRDAKIAGVIRKRAVYAPHDTVAWGRSVIRGLSTRGFTVETRPGSAADVHLKMTLQTVWVSDGVGGYSSNAVARIEANAANRRIDTVYRGRVTRTHFWSSGSNVAQSSIDGAWSKLLDALAVDLMPLCQEVPSASG